MAPSNDVRVTTPDKVDMRRFLWPIENLGEVLASAASAAATALEYHCGRMGEEPTNLSTMFIYYNARLSSGKENSNIGITMPAAMKAISTYGACLNSSWPVDVAKVATKPSAQAYEEAKKFSVVQGKNPLDVIEALALQYPVPFVCTLPLRCLREAGWASGVMPAPTAEELKKPTEWVNHAMVVVGYDKIAKTFLVRNCWGDQWGDRGHCTISFDMMKVITPDDSPRMWFITKKEVPKPDSETSRTGFRPAERPAPMAAAAAQPERLADLAAKMREEIRGDLHRDLADASKRIKDMMGRGQGALPPNVDALDVCPSCSGRRVCWGCGGKGCSSCGNGLVPNAADEAWCRERTQWRMASGAATNHRGCRRKHSSRDDTWCSAGRPTTQGCQECFVTKPASRWPPPRTFLEALWTWGGSAGPTASTWNDSALLSRRLRRVSSRR